MYQKILSRVRDTRLDLEKLFCDTSKYLDPSARTDWYARSRDVLSYESLVRNLNGKKNQLVRDLKDEYGQFLHECSLLSKRIHVHNEKVASEQLKDAYSIIGTVEGRALDRQQMVCVVKGAHNHLVVAGAGTGKTTTIVGKVKYLLATGTLQAKDILVLSFTNASASEINKRIVAETGVSVDAMTFHKLGMSILTKVNGIVPKVSQTDVRRFVSEMSANRLSISSELVRWALVYLFLNNGMDSQNKTNSMHTAPFVTLKGEQVKSGGELEIANFLALNGIEYEYEREYEVDTRTSKYGVYRPDFYLPEYGIYIEYFGIDRNGDVASFFSDKNGSSAKEAYNDSIAWKRKTHKDNKTKLVECYAYEKQEGTLLSSLNEKLKRSSVSYSPVSKEKLELEFFLDELKLKSFFTELNSKLINLIKSNGLSFIEFRNMLAKRGLLSQYKDYLDVFKPIYDSYCEMLSSKGEIDFNDMINESSRLVREGRFVNPYKLIIVDEYQDISKARFKLLEALRKTNNFDLFCVGDDWQSIYQFAGSDISYILQFEKYWGPTEISRIETTYRFPKELIRISGEFIMRNPAQIKKQLNATNDIIEPAVEAIFSYKGSNTSNSLESVLYSLPHNSTVFLIGRYNYDINVLSSVNFSFKCAAGGKQEIIMKSRPDLMISFLTAHRSKGLQADYVVILNNKNENSGFPSGPRNLPLVDLLLESSDNYPFAEERRLYYVALTRAKKKVFLLMTSAKVSSFATEVIDFSKKIQMFCPRCGGRLVLRKGRYGEFWGCSNYKTQNCRYTYSLSSQNEYFNVSKE